ncbi:MAG: AsmA family protein, partial [Wenzhouxiangella sp.]
PPGFADQPPLAEVGRATASLRVLPLIRGRLEIGAVGIEDAAFTIIDNADGRSNLDGLFTADAPPHPDEPGPDLSGLQTGDIRLENVLLRLLGDSDRSEFRIDRLALAPFTPGQSVPLKVSAAVLDDSGEAVITFDFGADIDLSPTLESLALDDWTLTYSLPGTEDSGRASGSTRIGFGAEAISLTVKGLESLLRADDLEIALTGTAPIEVALADTVEIDYPDLRLALNDQPLTLAGQARYDQRLQARLDVRGEGLDLTRLTPTAQEGQAESSGEADPGVLRLFDLHMNLDLDELVLAEGARLSAVSGRGRLDRGELVIDPMTAELFGGRFDGRASVDFNQQPPAVAVAPHLSGIMVDQLAEILTSASPVTGRGELALDVSFRGLSVPEILASLDGNGNFELNDGVVRGVDLRRLIEEELTVSNLGNISRAFGGETPFRNLTGSLRAEGGVVELPDLDLTARDYGAQGSGRIDLGADRVHYKLELNLGETLAARMPDRLRRATNGRIPLLIAGSTTAPTVTVDVAGIVERGLIDELSRRLFERDRADPEAEKENGGR